MDIVKYNGEINELYELWLNVSKDMPFTENIDKDVCKGSYLENIMTENICHLAWEEGELKGAAIIQIYAGWGTVLHFWVPRKEIGNEMSIALLTETIELCRMREVPHVSPRPLVGCPWLYEFFTGLNFVKNEDYPEGLWMRKSLEDIPDLDIPEGVDIYFTENLDDSDDLGTLTRFEAEITKEEHNLEIDLKKNIEALREEMQENNVVYGIAKIYSEMVGFSRTLFVELLSGEQIVKNQGLAVKKEYRKRGIGAALLTSSLSMVKDRGYETIFISTHSKNPARYLYRNIGFETIEIVPNLTCKIV